MANDLEGYAKAIEASLDDIAALNSKIELQAAQSARVALELRTFSTGGTGVKDVNGNKLSPYVKPKLVEGKRGMKKSKYGTWAEKRLAAGLQIDNKDLVFDKNSSRIMTSINVGVSDGK